MKYMNISVRGIVEFILRNGDIDNRISGAPTEEAMQEGSRIHRKIQASMGDDYDAEHPLDYEYDTKYYHIKVEGRADGIIRGMSALALTEGVDVVIDEIKGTYRDIKRLKEPDKEHLAQAQMYAAIYLRQNNLEQIGVQMTYVNMESEEFHYFRYVYSASEINDWFDNIISELTKWVDNYGAWIEMRQESIQTLEFPYPYRQGQRDLVGHVYRTIYHGKKLFIEAPTGTGKTLSTLFPAVRSMGEGRGDKIFYLTARTIARTVAEEAVNVLKKNGLKFRNVTLTAKEKICFCKDESGSAQCNPVACPYAKGHYDRINDCLYQMITTEDNFERPTIEKYALEYMVCPFELALDVSLFADLIIGDYNYAFDPRAYLRRFFATGAGMGNSSSGDYLFLIDEAHNLVDRGREMYSAVLYKEDFLECKKASGNYFPNITSAIEHCNKDMLEIKREREGIPDSELYEMPVLGKLVGHVDRLATLFKEYLADRNDGPEHDAFLDMYFKLSDFLNIYDLLGPDYVIYNGFSDDGNFFVKLFNVDPARNLRECMERARSSILFSATLLPIQYYKALLGGEDEDYEVYAQSIFDSSQRLMLQARDVSSKYTYRGYDQYLRMARYIYEITRRKKGNYIVFAPSYNFMSEVYEAYIDEFYDPEDEEIICQTNAMNERAKEEFLNRFKGWGNSSLEMDSDLKQLINYDIDIEDRTLIGFCVLGGIFSEGIDLKDDALIGVIVIGTGLPQIGGERDLLKEYFDRQGLDGFDYAYRYPGMNRVQQAAGRLIRTESDRGIIALLDDRYSQSANRRLFPREWSDIRLTNINTVGNMVDEFWN